VLHTWRLYANDIDTKLCPMRALIRVSMLYRSDRDLSRPLFLRVNKQGAVSEEPVVRMTCFQCFLPTLTCSEQTNSILSRALTTDLQNLGYKSWSLYGTHSFRRGGCQYRIRHKDWTVAMVAAWGGWTQVEALTMFRYFYSPNDNHEYMVDYD
jgi:hypothetical protein